MNSTLKIEWECENKKYESNVVIAARIAPLIEVNLNSIHLSADQPEAIVVVKRSTSTDQWNKLIAESQSSNIAVTTLKTNDNEWMVKAVASPFKCPTGRSNDGIVITCANREILLTPSTTIPVSIHILGRLKASPPSIYLGVIPKGKTKILKSSILSTDHSLLELFSIESSKPEFATALAETKFGSEIKLNCTFDPSKGMENQSGRFLIRVRVDGKEETLALPFIAFVKEAEKIR